VATTIKLKVNGKDEVLHADDRACHCCTPCAMTLVCADLILDAVSRSAARARCIMPLMQ